VIVFYVFFYPMILSFERPCICALRISILPQSTIFLLNFRTVWYFLFLIFFYSLGCHEWTGPCCFYLIKDNWIVLHNHTKISFLCCILYIIVSSLLIIAYHFDCFIVCPEKQWSGQTIQQSKWQTMIRTDDTTVKMTNNDQDRRYNSQNESWSLFVILTVVSSVLIIVCHFDCCIVCPDHCLSFLLLYCLSWSLFVILTVVLSVLIIVCHFDCCIILKTFAWLDGGSNQRSTAHEVITLSSTPRMRLDIQNKASVSDMN
jgi:hypothetical protein